VSSVGYMTDPLAAAAYALIGFFIGLKFRHAVDWVFLQIRGRRVRG